MKKLLLCLSLAACISLPVAAQTNTNNPILTGPGADAWTFLTASASNWIVAPYGIASTDGKTFGAGLGVGYKLSEFVVPTLRIDGVDSTDGFTVWMPSASLQLQAPVKILNAVTVVPFAFAGIATPIAGQHENNGSVVGIFGVGGAIRLGKNWDLLGDFEIWNGGGFSSQQQIRFGFGWKPKAW